MKIEFLANYSHLIPEIAELKYQNYRHLLPNHTLQNYKEGLEKYLNTTELPIGYVIVEQGAFVGAFSLKVCDLESHAHLTPWLGSVFVHPAHRNQGVGRFIVSQAKELALQRGFKRLYLYTSEKQAFYESLGWRAFEYSTLHGTGIVLMSIDLGPVLQK